MKGALSWGKASRMDVLEHVLVRLITDTGHMGQAEAPPRPTIYGETPESVQAIIQRYLAPALVGRDIMDVERLSEVTAVVVNNFAAKSAIDICLYEAQARTQGLTLFDLLQPVTRRIKVSYILGMADPETMLAEARAVYDQGVRVLKVKVGRNFSHDLGLIQALQSEFRGDSLDLYADANEGLSPDQAADQLGRLADLGLLYVEEPLPVELIPERAQLRAAHSLPLIADDSCFSLRDLNRELRFDTFDILNIKTARTGYTQSKQMLARARQHGKGIMVGSQASSTLGAVRAAFFAGLPGIEHPSELSFFLKLEDDIVNRPIQINAGFIDLESLVDIDIDEAKLRRAAVD